MNNINLETDICRKNKKIKGIKQLYFIDKKNSNSTGGEIKFNLKDLEKEEQENLNYIIDKNFPEYEKEVLDLVRQYGDESIAREIYAGKHRIGFCTNEEYNNEERIINWRRKEFYRLLHKDFYT